MRRRIRKRLTVASLAAILLATAGTTAAQAEGDLWPGQKAPLVLQEGEEVPVLDEPVGGEEVLALPPVTEEMNELASALSEQYSSHPQFSSVEVTRDRTQVIVYWNGEVDPGVDELISAAPGVAAVIEQTPYHPGDLREAARRLVESHDEIGSAAALHDGSGIRVSLDVISSQARRSTSGTQDQIRREVPYPLTFDDQAPTRAFDNTRLSDISFHFGGARITSFNTGSGCTSGFSVAKNDDPGVRGLMFAAHCGAVGEQWVTFDRTVTPIQPYLFGTTSTRDTLNDGAIMTSSFAQPYMWTAAYNSTVYSKINGQTTSYVGQELCLSGSYSGLNCGNIVASTTELYNLGGDLTSVFGLRTTNINGAPAAGNGDSGGPGYTIVSTSTGSQRLAVGIISAIPNPSPTTCQGVPGAENGRKCSPTVWLTSVVTIGNNAGWHVPTVS